MTIIPDNSPSPKGHHPSRQHIPSVPSEGSGLPPPPPYANHQTSTQYVVVVDHRVSPERRFFRAFLVAVSIWVLTGIFVSSAVELQKSIWRDGVGIPTIEDGYIDHCAPWASGFGPEHPLPSLFSSGAWSQARFNLSADADALYLIARGALSPGYLYVRESHKAEDVSVTIFAHRRGAGSHPRASVCRLSRDGGQMGVGIFGLRGWWHMPWPGRGKDLRFVIEVELPPRNGAVRYIPSFHADLPMFALAMGDLSAFRFGDVALKSSNSPIKVEGLFANSLNIHSTNGAISGNFNTTDSLTLTTTNSPVSVKVGAENGKSEKSTEVLIRNTNALIEAHISLTSKSSRGTGGVFGVHAHTTNGPIMIVYDDSPLDSVLVFDAHSTNSAIQTALHDAYEGTFSLQTTNSHVVLDHSRDIEDPSGRGRKRRLSTRSVTRQAVYGDVEWSPSSSDSRAGTVDITTTNDLIKLSI